MIPVVVFRGIDPSPALEADIRTRAGSLRKYCRTLIGCRVLIERPPRHRKAGNRYHVRIELSVPGEDVVVVHDAALGDVARSTDAERIRKSDERASERRRARVAIRHAFDIARRRLQDRERRARHQTKVAARQPRGRVVRLVPGQGYGYLEAADGHRVYFERDSVLGDAFDRLVVGAEVSFVDQPASSGPRASTVRLRHPKRRTPARSGSGKGQQRTESA